MTKTKTVAIKKRLGLKTPAPTRFKIKNPGNLPKKATKTSFFNFTSESPAIKQRASSGNKGRRKAKNKTNVPLLSEKESNLFNVFLFIFNTTTVLIY